MKLFFKIFIFYAKNNKYKLKMLKAIKSKLILTKIFSNIPHKKVLNIVHYNKHLQKGINISIDSFIKNYNKIIIEIILD